MRTPRIVILLFFLFASLFLLFRALTASRRAAASRYATEVRSNKSVWSLIFYNTPFSLFPPNAAISLTDDNSTSFAARPAAFGPRLVPNGLSGQLWVGSGFTDDNLDGNGELGCSDLPGWDGGGARSFLKKSFQAATPRIDVSNSRSDHPKHSGHLLDASTGAVIDDGTDNHLHKDLISPSARRDSTASSSHADIQSIQEGAEIEGKVVLLMRGGCGFLEKVMWAQRRGATAVIVGDNVKGGPLIQMFAHGDEVDNVTVPSVFTARTTAQLLSSLTQPGSFIEDTLDDNGSPHIKVQQGSKPSRKRKKHKMAAAEASLRNSRVSTRMKRGLEKEETKVKPGSLLLRIFNWGTSSRAVDSESRPPRSGQLGWALTEEPNNEKDKSVRKSMAKMKKDLERPKLRGYDFLIGVQDWRDPGLMNDQVPGSGKKKAADNNAEQKATFGLEEKFFSKHSPQMDEPNGGSITPGSGEYKPRKALGDEKAANSELRTRGGDPSAKRHSLISKLFRDGEDDKPELLSSDTDSSDLDDDPMPLPHEGLWVTIAPTSGASPFFDTLLVLVVSPLVTLTVVYALLVIRAKIRRRRWRAPKSVVERLPVRTYHTVARSPSLPPMLPSPSSASPTTPLLQQTSSPPRSRPRSRTANGAMESDNLLAPSASVPTPCTVARVLGRPEHEKGSGGFSAEWKKYMGRQVECVVCLEEYVDGVSRVMRLPCGHEFHADCITPWLTTRRRTCPICKGDVVRSMARGSWTDPRFEPYHDDADDEPEAEGSGYLSSIEDSDVEQGRASPGPSEERRQNWQDSFFGILPSSAGDRRRSRSGSPSPEDHNR